MGENNLPGVVTHAASRREFESTPPIVSPTPNPFRHHATHENQCKIVITNTT